MARKKPKKLTSSDLYNARRRAKYALSNLEKINIRKLKNSDRKLYAQFKRDLKTLIKSSYGKQDSIADTIAVLDAYSRAGKKSLSTKERRNLITERRISNQIKDFSDARKKAYFYRATQRLWEGAPPSERNRIIAQHFNGDLSDAWDYVFSNKRVKKELSKKEKALAPIKGATDEAQAFYSDVTDIAIIDSPDFTPIRFKK